ncbi:MAG: transcriptional repressor [Phycisphaeraceae bacterium]|nr:transcriptional repressor [Phycisphaeraceae bacterium]
MLYEALAATTSHPTAEELLAMVRESDTDLSLATVYNTLDAFSECGLIRRLSSLDGKGPCRFDATTSEHAHVLLPDGRITDVPEEISAGLVRAVNPSALSSLGGHLGVPSDRLRLRVTVEVVAEPGARESEDND